MFKNLFGSKKEQEPASIKEALMQAKEIDPQKEIQKEALVDLMQMDQAAGLYDESALEEFKEWDVTLEDGLEESEFQNTLTEDYLLTAPEIAGWGSTQEQELLFSALLLFYSPEMSILDVGCGRADLFGYLTKTFGVEPIYKGIDYNPNMLAISRMKYPTVSVAQSDILDMTENADWVVGSGLFNIKDQDDMVTYTKQCIDKMYKSANIGIAFNMLTGYPDDIADEDKAVLAPHNPSVWLDYLIENYTKVICRTDYMLGDVTFFILK